MLHPFFLLLLLLLGGGGGGSYPTFKRKIELSQSALSGTDWILSGDTIVEYLHSS